MATASSIGFASLWVSAVQNYELSTGRVLANDDTFARIKTLEELQLTLQSQEDGFASFRAQNKGIADKLTTCFSPLVPLLDLAGKAIGATPYAPVAVAFGAVAHLFKASTSVTKSYDSVEELFEEVGNITTRLQSYDGDATEESLRAKVTTILAYILEIVGTAEKLVKRGRFKQWARSVFVQDDEIGEGLTKLRRFVDGELGLVTALTYARVGETQGDVRAVAKALDEVKVSVESSNQALADAKQTALSRADEELLKASLAPQTHTAVLRKHSNNLTSLAPDTGNWLHDETSFQAWLADDFPVFWVLGKRGVGKTFLAARAYEVLKAAKQHLVSIAYFEEQTSALQNSEDILRSAAAQLGQQIEAFRSHAIEVFRKCEGAFDVRSFWSNVVLDFFCQPSSSTPSSDSAIIVIDGIDEASRQERSALFSCLAELVKVASATQTCKLKVIIFTRPDVFGDPGFHDHGIYRSVESSTVTSDKNSSDIASYIKQEIAKHEFLKNLKKTKKLSLCGRLARAIYHSISTRAQGMFQWASLVFDQIRDLRSAESIMKALEDSPAELDAMLHHTLKKLATEVPATQAYLHDLLLWVLDDGWNVTVADLFVLLRLTLKESFYMLESDLRWKFSSIFEIREIKYVNRESRQPPPESEESLSTSGASDDDFLDLPDDELVDFDDLSLSSTDMDFAQVKDGTLVTSMAIDGEIPAHWDDLEITFAHASIVEFLKIELGPQRRWHDLSLHREGRSNAEHRMFRALLELQQNYASGPICDTAFYYKFVYGWYHRFTALGLGEEFDTETILLAQSLANLFSNGEAVMKWAYIEPNRFVILSFSSDQIPCLIQQLLDKHSATLPPEQQQWVQEINVSVRALFRPMAEVCARAWLVHNSWNDEFYMKRQVDEQDAAMILCAYNRLCERPTAQLALNDGPDDRFHRTRVYMAATDVPSTAESLVLPKTAHWYTCVGWAILTKTPTDLPKPEDQERAVCAIDYFEKAIEMDPGAWPAHAGLGQCYGAGLADYAKGIRSLQDAIAVMQQTADLGGMVTRFQAIIGSWSLHHPETAVTAAREAFNGLLGLPYPRDIQDRRLFNQTVRNYLQAMCDAKQHEDVEKFGLRLSNAKVEFYSKSIWACFLEDWRIDEIGASEDRISSLLGNLTNAANASAIVCLIQSGVSELDFPGYGIAFSPVTFMTTTQWIQWLYEHSAPSDDFLEMCRKFLQGYEDRQYVARDWHQIIGFMAATYLKRAITAHHSGLDTTADIANLQELGRRKHHMKSQAPADFAMSLYGLWRHEYCSTNDDEWKTYMRPAIIEALAALNDDDAFKRQSAYARLGESLLRAKDLENAHMALGLTLMPLHAYQLAKQEQREMTPLPVESIFTGWYVFWKCDAPFGCETPAWEYEEVWFCRMCYNTNFCGSCVKKVKEGEGDWAARCHCSKDHDLVRVFPLGEEVKRMVENVTQGESGEFDVWLGKVREEWR